MISSLAPTSICFILSVTATSITYAGRDKEFKEYLNQARSLTKNIAKSASGFALEKIFDNYSYSPEPAKYYSEESATASQTLKSDSISSLILNKEGQAIAESSKIRPQFQINNESEEIRDSKRIQTLASKNIQGAVEGFLTGDEEQINTTGTKYLIKTCNEEIRSLTRVCTKTPLVTTVTESFGYPNCRKAYVVDGAYEGISCANGYSPVVAVDRKEINIGGGRAWNTARLCVKPADPGEKTQCLVGYIAYGASSAIGGGNARLNTSPTTIPKGMHARVAFHGITHNVPMRVTLINKTTNKIIYDGNFSNGQAVELPFSETQDQVFQYYFTQDQQNVFFSRYNYQTGLMCLYVDSIGTKKVAKVAWQEGCRDV